MFFWDKGQAFLRSVDDKVLDVCPISYQEEALRFQGSERLSNLLREVGDFARFFFCRQYDMGSLFDERAGKQNRGNHPSNMESFRASFAF